MGKGVKIMENEEKSWGFGLGPIFILLAAICFATGGLFMKYVPWNAMSVNSGRNTIAVIILFLFLRISKHKIIFNRTVLIGAIAVTGTNILFAFANKLTTAGNAIILQYTAPVFVILWSLMIYKKKPARLDLVTAFFVFTGVIFFFVDGLSSGNMLGNALALLSGITYSGVFMANASKDSDPLSSTFWGMAANSLIGMPWLFQENFAATPNSAWIAIIALGVIQLAAAYIFMAKGLETTPPVAASLICGIEPILSPTLVAVFYGETLTPLSLVGAAIVFITIIIYNVLRARQTR